MVEPVVWFGYSLHGDGSHVESVEVDLPEAFRLFAAGTVFRAIVPQWLYGRVVLEATVVVDIGGDDGGGLGVDGATVAGLRLEPFGPCSEVSVACRHGELAAAQAVLPEVGKLASRAFEWAQRKALEVANG